MTVAILATNDESSIGTTSGKPISEIRYGGFNPATGQPLSSQTSERTSVQRAPEVARPDESKVAAAIARGRQARTPSQAQTPSQHDESDVAVAISGH